MQVEPISISNVSAAMALLETVTPPRPSLRASLLAEGSEGYVVTEAGRLVLAVAAIRQDGGDADRLARIASVRPRETRRWLEGLGSSARALFSGPRSIECILHVWEEGAAAFLEGLGLRSTGTTFYMTSRARQVMPEMHLVAPSAAVLRACFDIDRAATRSNEELRSSSPSHHSDAESAEIEAEFADFTRGAERFMTRGDLFAFGEDGRVCAYLLLDENAIDSVVVDPAMHRRGIGAKVVRFACATLERRGHEEVSLLTSSTNLDAVRLYEGLGFRMHSFNRWLARDAADAGADAATGIAE